MIHNRLFAHFRTENFFRLDARHHFRQGTRMIHFHMVDDKVINFFRLGELGDMMEQFTGVALLDGVKKGNLFILDQVGVIGGSLVSGIPMEIADIPVDCTYPVDVRFNFNRFHVFSLCVVLIF